MANANTNYLLKALGVFGANSSKSKPIVEEPIPQTLSPVSPVIDGDVLEKCMTTKGDFNNTPFS